MKRHFRLGLLAACAICTCAVVTYASEEDDIVVGRTAAGQLAAEFDSAELFPLPVVTFIPGNGFGLDDPGFFALDTDEPAEDLFTLDPAAQIRIELLSKAPDLQVLNATLFTTLLANPGDQWAMPDGNIFDEHPFWFVNDPDFSELGQTFDFTFKLVDASGTYADSIPITAQLVAVPEPHSLMLLSVAALGLMRRR